MIDDSHNAELAVLVRSILSAATGRRPAAVHCDAGIVVADGICGAAPEGADLAERASRIETLAQTLRLGIATAMSHAAPGSTAAAVATWNVHAPVGDDTLIVAFTLRPDAEPRATGARPSVPTDLYALPDIGSIESYARALPTKASRAALAAAIDAASTQDLGTVTLRPIDAPAPSAGPAPEPVAPLAFTGPPRLDAGPELGAAPHGRRQPLERQLDAIDSHARSLDETMAELRATVTA